jgi:AGCS family alanine or glycine:cation symporter
MSIFIYFLMLKKFLMTHISKYVKFLFLISKSRYMVDNIFNIFSFLESFIWTYIGVIYICAAGLYLTYKSDFFQFKALLNVRSNIKKLINDSKISQEAGVNPIKLYFASVGGMVGLGNITGITVGVLTAGPGIIVWLWIASFMGMLVKYSEIYLGVKYRVTNDHSGFDGGPMYFLPIAFRYKATGILVAVLLCIYGVEVWQFAVVADNIHNTFNIDKVYVIFFLLFIVLYASIGGIKRLADVCSIFMPFFMISYIIMCFYIVFANFNVLPEKFALILKSAFYGVDAVKSFTGASIIFIAHNAISRAVYSGDIGIGFDSIVQSETRIVDPKQQATLSIYALFSDTFICTMTALVLVVTDAWQFLDVNKTNVIKDVFADYFYYMDSFFVILLFFAGYTTLIAYLTVGLKCARYLNPKYGRIIYLLYAIPAFVFFSFHDQNKVYTLMQLSSGLLMLINLTAILKLSNRIEF